MFSLGQEILSWLAGQFCSVSVSHEVAIRCYMGLHLSEGLTGAG